MREREGEEGDGLRERGRCNVDGFDPSHILSSSYDLIFSHNIPQIFSVRPHPPSPMQTPKALTSGRFVIGGSVKKEKEEARRAKIYNPSLSLTPSPSISLKTVLF